jgi:DNA topoisomerase-2
MSVSASDYILDIQRSYALYTNNGRYIPNATDGLKRAMRQAMEVMYSHNGRFKTSALSGAMQERNLYPHGDASDSISSLAAPFINNVPLLRAHGTFGTKVNPTAFAAPRYTDVDKPPYINDLFYLDRDILPLKDNFDGSRKEPKTFLPIIPTLLVNGMVGIGTGWSCTILPRNINDICEAVIDVLNGKKPKRLLPDYSWAKTNCEFIEYNDKGNAKWLFIGEVEMPDTSSIRVTELPSGLSLEDFKSKLSTMEENGTIKDFIDNSSNEISVTIKLKRGQCKGWSNADAIDFLNLKKTRTENFVVVGFDGDTITPYAYDGKTDPIEQYIKDWVEWRFGWYTDRYNHLKKETTDELNYLRLLFECYARNLPMVLGDLKNKAELKGMIEAIGNEAKISFGDHHVERICNRATYSWTRDNSLKVVEDIKEKEKELDEFNLLLNDEKKRRGVFLTEVNAIKSAVPNIKKSIDTIRGKKAK